MSQKHDTALGVIGIDIGKDSFHVVGLDQRGIALRQKWLRIPTKSPGHSEMMSPALRGKLTDNGPPRRRSMRYLRRS
jgi:hypothetical protein